MIDYKYKIWIEAEVWEDGWNIFEDNTDVIVEFEDENKWIATFFTYNNIQTLIEKDKHTGENLNGKYFWASDMVLVDEISRIRIEEVIKHFIEEDLFQTIFNRIE